MHFPTGKIPSETQRKRLRLNRFVYSRLANNPKSPGGKHVTITVRETTTERINPTNQQYQDIDRQIIKSNSQSYAPRASSATKELDDLMASLSDFKVSTKLAKCIFSVSRQLVSCGCSSRMAESV